MLLDRADARVAALTGEVTALRADTPAVEEPEQGDRILGFYEDHAGDISMSGKDSVEFIESERQGIGMSGLLNALLGGE